MHKNKLYNGNNTNIITQSIFYHDKIKDNFDMLFDKDVKICFLNTDTNKEHRIIFFYKNNKLLFSSRFENYWIYENKSKILCWAWAVHYTNKFEKSISKKIFNYFSDSEEQIFSSEKSLFLNSKFIVSRKILLDFYNGFGSYVVKSLIYTYNRHFKNTNTNNNIMLSRSIILLDLDTYSSFAENIKRYRETIMQSHLHKINSLDSTSFYNLEQSDNLKLNFD